MVITPQALRAIFNGFNTLFQNAFNVTQQQFSRVAMEVPSSTSEETYGWLGSFPRIRQWIGDRELQNLQAHAFTIKNLDFEGTVVVPRPTIEDDKFGVFNPVVSQIGQAAKLHPDELVFSLLARGFETRCYDGQYFFDEDHGVRDASGVVRSVSNMQDGGGAFWALLDASKIVKPVIWQKRKDYKFISLVNENDPNVAFRNEYVYGTDGRGNAGLGLWQLAHGSRAPLTPENYAAARIAMKSLKGDGGRPLHVTPTLLVYEPSLEHQAREIVMRERLANGADNIYRGTAELLDSPFLSV